MSNISTPELLTENVTPAIKGVILFIPFRDTLHGGALVFESLCPIGFRRGATNKDAHSYDYTNHEAKEHFEFTIHQIHPTICAKPRKNAVQITVDRAVVAQVLSRIDLRCSQIALIILFVDPVYRLQCSRTDVFLGL